MFKSFCSLWSYIKYLCITLAWRLGAVLFLVTNRCHYYSQYTLLRQDQSCMLQQSTRSVPGCVFVIFWSQSSTLDPEITSLESDSHALRLALIPRLERGAVYQPLIWHERNRSVLSPRLDGMKCQSNQRWWKLIALMSTWPCNFISSLHMPLCGFTLITTCIK